MDIQQPATLAESRKAPIVVGSGDWLGIRIMKNNFCDLDETQLRAMKIPEIAVGLLTSPFQHNVEGPWVRVPVETFKQFTDVVTEYVKNAQMPNEKS